MNHIRLLSVLALAAVALSACAHDEIGGLELERVVLYRNGVGYFERSGPVDGDVLTIKCRKDQVNDVLKSLTVVDRGTGQALSVSMPLDPQSWANAALATLAPGNGNLAEVLDALRGTRVTLTTGETQVSGRIMMVEMLGGTEGARPDHRLTLMSGDELNVVLLSKVSSVVFEDDALALQLHRSLDASAGEGMFQEVEVAVRLSSDAEHDVAISYVVAAPMWKPTYRVVLPDGDTGKALLQGWAVVDNTSGEEWQDVALSLTSGAPIAFQYDLHTPLTPGRSDMTSQGTAKVARVAVGESTMAPPPAPMAAPKVTTRATASGPRGGERRRKAKKMKAKSMYDYNALDEAEMPMPEGSSAVMFDELQRSTGAKTSAKRVSGLTQFNLQERVTVPEGSSTMVAILNESIKADQAFLFRPGGSGAGYETNPYRIVRFHNETPFVLEPGPISIYAGGSFVGEGISETIAAGASATVPFSVEPNISVTSTTKNTSGEVRLLKITKGTLYVETFQRYVTTWKVVGPTEASDYKVLIRHRRYGNQYELKDRPKNTEDVDGGYLLPIIVKAGTTEASLEVVEQTPARTHFSVWNGGSLKVFETLLAGSNLDAAARKRIQPIFALRRDVGDIDQEVANLKRRQSELDHRASETRANLEAIKKDPAAGNLRARLNKRLDQFTKEGDKLGRQVVELTTKRLEKKIELDELLESFTFDAPAAK